jgi:anti-sigma regulatory factor (Ser/Thr protein kinase)
MNRTGAPAEACDGGQTLLYARDLARLYALERQREEDLRLGAAMQRRFLTPAEEVAGLLAPLGWRCAIANSSPTDISGDFFSARLVGERIAGFFLADACGHGLSAALMSMRLASLIQFACHRHADATDYMHELDGDVQGLDFRKKFVTGLFALFDGCRVTLVNAGQPWPVLVRDGRVEEIELPGPPLGVGLSGLGFSSIDLQMEEGDLLVLSTDGLVEAADADDEPWGRERMLQSIRDAAGQTPQGMCARIEADMREWLGEVQPDDDVTLAVFGRAPGGANRRYWRVAGLESEQEDILQGIDDLIWLCDLDETCRDLFLLAVAEAVANAVEHGNRLDQRRSIEVRTAAARGLVAVLVRDEGGGYEPVWPDLRTSHGPRGRGLGIVRENSDAVFFDRTANTIILMKGGRTMELSSVNCTGRLTRFAGEAALVADLEFSGRKTGLAHGLGEIFEEVSREPARVVLFDMRKVRMITSMAWGQIFAEVERPDLSRLVLFNAAEAVLATARQMGLGSRGGDYAKIEVYPGCVEAFEIIAEGAAEQGRC